MMRNFSLVFLAVFLAGLFAAGEAGALTIEAGNLRMQTTDWSVFDTSAPLPGFGAAPQGSNDFWSVLRVDNISDNNGNVTWRSGDGGQFISGVIGGMTVNHTSVNQTTGVYFTNASNGSGPNYFRLFISGSDNSVGAAGRGFEAGPNLAGKGAFGSFGGSILSGTPWLSASFNPGALVALEAGTVSGGAVQGDKYRLVLLDPGTAQSTGFLDVDPTAGAGSLFNSNTQIAGTDIKITETIDARDPALFGGWNGISSGQAFGAAVPVIPEPGTIILLGSGLIGIGIYTRRRFVK